MSQESRATQDDPRGNAARHSEAIAAWNEGDFERCMSYFDEHVVMRHPNGWPEPGPSLGIDAVTAEFARLWEVGGRLDYIVEPFAVGDRTVVRYRWPTPPTDGEFTQVGTWRDGKMVYVEVFWDHDEALRAVGLSE